MKLGLRAEGLANVYLKYKHAGVPAEFHIYSKVGRGFGMRGSNQGVISTWPQRLIEWFEENGIMKK
jgi:hypothetical protein